MNVCAQHDIYLGGQLDMGLAGKTDFENSRLDKKFFSPHLGGLVFVNFRLFDVIALEAGLGQHWNNSRFKDPSFEKANEGFSVKMNNKNYFWNYYVAISGMYRIGNTDTYLYGKLAYSINDYGGRTVENSKSFIISRLNTDQTISTTSSYVSSNQSFIPEIGIQQKLAKRNLISVGLKMNIGSEDALKGTYSVTDNLTGEVTSNNFSSLGDFMTLSLSYSMSLHHIPKKEKVKRIRERKPKETEPEPESKTPTEVADRKLIIEEKVKVHSSKVIVEMWDHQAEDGDRVSLNFNGEWILKNYTLKKEKYVFELELDEGLNTFVLHALNLGKYGSNTAALNVKDGLKEHKIILESDMKESGTLEINYKKKKE